MQRATKTSTSGGGDKDNFRPDIEGLRGIAVMLVVLFHAGLLSASGVQVTGGFIGVDLFFVVSGYLITGLLIRERERNGKISFSRFYARRVRRILPAAAVVILVTLFLSTQLVTLVERSSTMQDGAAAAVSIANIRFAATTDYFHPANYSPFLHFWSLGVEEQFYFIWPAILAIVAWKRPRLGVGIALAVIVAVSLAASIAITDTSPAAAFYLLPTRAWQLGAGGLLAVATGAGVLSRVPGFIRDLFGRFMAIVGWISLAALLVAAWVISSDTAYPGTAAIVPTVAGVLLIASGGERLGPGLLLRLSPIRFLGKISYSLYLWHWPMLILAQLYLTGSPQVPLTPFQAIVVAAFAIPVATVSWALIEEPFRRGQIPLPRPSRTVIAGVAVMLLVALMGTSFAWSADATAKSVFGDTSSTPTDTPAPDATDTPFVATPVPPSLPPGATPTPTPQLTPALSPYPDSGTSTYSVAGLRPSVLNAANDYEQPWHDNCLGWDATTAPARWGKCVYGNPKGTYEVAIIGDSHASALFPAVNAVAKAHGWKLVIYLKIDCSFVDMPTEDFNRKNEYTECETWNRNVIAAMKVHPPDLAIVSQSRWIFGWPIGSNSSLSAQEQAMAREIKMIPSSTKVVIIQDPPLPTSVNVPDCLSSNTNDYRRCAFSRANAEGSSMGKREQYAAKVTGAGLIDLTSYICPGTKGPCPAVINGMIVWRDEHHLTATFAKTLAPAVDEQLVAIMNGWASPTPSQ